ncbi:four helix bundle protein [Ruminococcus sp.]|uniref:four helix bundle protein n=1 Tax=Ruminococcus sp. TaxID=41978 RepID=UPI002E76F58C|nr:four helix bundle protein [Ruminococcus sp.]MEE1262456.1 four helix bundle protein [Ruminococcus sp.]
MDKNMSYQSPSPLRTKSRNFAIRIIKLYQTLRTEKKEYILSNQILKSGTSIGANIAESECAFSKKDFLAKVYIALKECNETLYWLDLLHETGYLTEEGFRSLWMDCNELRKMLSATTKTVSEHLEAEK